MPLALLFLQANPTYRAIAILLAMATDGLDGFIARRFHLCNRVGTLLDPIMDKFFVFFVLTVLIGENRLTGVEACLFICRDFSVILYGIYLAIRGRLGSYKFRAIWCGKITTVLQFIVLLGLAFGLELPVYLFIFFIILGIMALGELYLFDSRRRSHLPVNQG
jgi:phosphatidylglycerophosphate synthase